MNCLVFVFTSTVLIGSLSADPVVVQPPITFNQSEINFFEQCKTLTGDDTIIERVKAMATEYELCDVVLFSKFMDTISFYVKGNADAITDVKNFIGENCPKVRNGLDCTTKFANSASMCYKNNDHTKMLTQIEAIKGVIDYMCADEGQHIVEMKEANIYGCLEDNKVSVSRCLYVEDDDESKQEPKVDIAFSPITIESKIVCRIPEQRDCIIESVNGCTDASPQIAAVADVFTSFIKSACT